VAGRAWRLVLQNTWDQPRLRWRRDTNRECLLIRTVTVPVGERTALGDIAVSITHVIGMHALYSTTSVLHEKRTLGPVLLLCKVLHTYSSTHLLSTARLMMGWKVTSVWLYMRSFNFKGMSGVCTLTRYSYVLVSMPWTLDSEYPHLRRIPRRSCYHMTLAVVRRSNEDRVCLHRHRNESVESFRG
jgi:hypothetical protein